MYYIIYHTISYRIVFYPIVYHIILYHIIYINNALFQLKRLFLYVLLPTMTVDFPFSARSTIALCIHNFT